MMHKEELVKVSIKMTLQSVRTCSCTIFYCHMSVVFSHSRIKRWKYLHA